MAKLSGIPTPAKPRRPAPCDGIAAVRPQPGPHKHTDVIQRTQPEAQASVSPDLAAVKTTPTEAGLRGALRSASDDARAERRARLLALSAKAKAKAIKPTTRSGRQSTAGRTRGSHGLGTESDGSGSGGRGSSRSRSRSGSRLSDSGFIVSDDAEISSCESSWLDFGSESQSECEAGRASVREERLAAKQSRRRLVRGRPCRRSDDALRSTSEDVDATPSRSPSRRRYDAKHDSEGIRPGNGIVYEGSAGGIPTRHGSARELARKVEGTSTRRHPRLTPSLTSSTTLSGDSDHEPSSSSSTSVAEELPDPQLPTGDSTKLRSPSKSPVKRRNQLQFSDANHDDRFAPAGRRLFDLDQLLKTFNDDDDDDADGDDVFTLKPKIKLPPPADTAASLVKAPPSSSTESPRKSQRALQLEARAAKKEQQAKKQAFDLAKDSMAKKLLCVLDQEATDGQIGRLAASEGGVKILWSKTLNKTAGRANWKRITATSPCGTSAIARGTPPVAKCDQAVRDSANSSSSSSSSSKQTTTVRHIASIELAEKIIDCEDRLYRTLAHEFCHLANFMISHIVDNPHGDSFKRWADKCVAVLARHADYSHFGITITTRHTYEIAYKYVWSCGQCGLEYGRHSKSIDPSKVRCGRCKTGSLTQIRPKPRNVSPVKKAAQAPAAKGAAGGPAEAGTAVRSLTTKMEVITLDD